MQSEICSGKMNYWVYTLLFFLRISLLKTLFLAGLENIQCRGTFKGLSPKRFPI